MSRPHPAGWRLTPADIQRRVDLQQLARFYLGPGIPAGQALVFWIPQFDPDHPDYHVYRDYFRNPTTGDRGSAIKLVMRLRRCPYDQAIAFLEGWLMALGMGRP